MKFAAIIALVSVASSHKLARRDPDIEDSANSWGHTQTAGKAVYSKLENTYRSVAPLEPEHFANDSGVMKIQRDPSWAFDHPHTKYHSNQSTGNAGQAGEFSNGGTLTKGALGA